MAKTCHNCMYWKDVERVLGGDCDEGYSYWFRGSCTFDPKHVETASDHYCSHWEKTKKLEEYQFTVPW